MCYIEREAVRMMKKKWRRRLSLVIAMMMVFGVMGANGIVFAETGADAAADQNLQQQTGSDPDKEVKSQDNDKQVGNTPEEVSKQTEAAQTVQQEEKKTSETAVAGKKSAAKTSSNTAKLKSGPADTFLSNGGSYTLEYILKNYNMFVKGDAKTQHVIGPMAIGGGLSGNQTSYGGLSVKDPKLGFNYAHTTHTYVKGSTGQFNQLITSNNKINLYLGTVNKGKKYTLVDKVGDNGAATSYTQSRYYFTDEYIDFDKAFTALAKEAASLVGTTKLTKDQLKSGNVDRAGYHLTGNVLQVKLGTHLDLETMEGITTINFKGDKDQLQNTIITAENESVNIYKTLLNGAEWNQREEATAGIGIVYVFPNATTVKANATVGHMVAPEASATLTGGNYNGCVIADTLNTTAAEMHMWPYNGGELKPSDTTFSIGKTLDGGAPGEAAFEFKAEQISGPEGTAFSKTVKNDTAGKVDFGKISYEKAGTYIYEISEVGQSAGTDYTYDSAKYYVKVSVSSSKVGEDTQLTTDSTKYYKDKDCTQQLESNSVTFENKTKEQKSSLTVTKKLTVNGQEETTAIKDTFYVRLFDAEGKAASEVKAIAYDGAKTANSVTFDDLTVGNTYTVWETDKDGNKIAKGGDYVTENYSYQVTATGQEVTVAPQAQEVAITNDLPEGYYYDGKLIINKEVLRGEAPYAVTATYYAGIFTDQDCTTPLKLDQDGSGTETPVIVALELENESETSVTVEGLPVDPETKTATYYVAETDKDGNKIAGSTGINYTVSVENDGKVDIDSKTTVETSAEITITNTFSEGSLTVTKKVTINNEEQSNTIQDTFYVALFNGNELASEVKAIAYDGEKTANSVTFDGLTVGDTYTVWETDKDGNKIAKDSDYTGESYTYQVTETGQEVTIQTETSASITNNLTEQYYRDAELKINKKVMRGETPYAVTATYYAGVFTDKDCTSLLKLNQDGEETPVIVPLNLENQSETTATVTGLPVDPQDNTAQYYVAETDRDGNLIADSSAINYTVTVENDGAVTVDAEKTGENASTITITNTFAEGGLTVTKQITRNGQPIDEAIEDTFYAGLFDGDGNAVSEIKAIHYSGTDASSVTFDGLTVGETYYVYETDRDGNPLTLGSPYESDTSAYTVSGGSGQQVEIGTQTAATITNDLSEGYYYDGGLEITKKVKLGKEDYNVVNTYYAGIFTDESCTTLMKLDMDGDGNEEDAVVALKLNDESEGTVAISQIPFGTYYIAETDRNGKPLDESKTEFGISIDNPVAKVAAEETAKVVITNTYDKKMTTSSIDKKTPQTGDDFNGGLMLMLLLIAMTAMAAVLIGRKRSSRR